MPDVQERGGGGFSLKILFVCAGNINRSPAAEFVFNQLACDAAGTKAVMAESAGLQPGDCIDERTVKALKKKYGSTEWNENLDLFLKSFKPRSVYDLKTGSFNEIWALDKQILGFLREQSIRARLFPPNGVKDPAAIYPSKSGDVYLDALNEVEKGVKILLKT